MSPTFDNEFTENCNLTSEQGQHYMSIERFGTLSETLFEDTSAHILATEEWLCHDDHQ